jgi:hypothetical protein
VLLLNPIVYKSSKDLTLRLYSHSCLVHLYIVVSHFDHSQTSKTCLTMSIRSSISRSRLLTTLSSTTPVAASTLVPPYSHSQAIPQEPSPSLRPPYAHQSPVEGDKKVQPTSRYALLDRTSERKEVEERYLAWATGLGEEQVNKLWLETLEGLKKSGATGVCRPFELVYQADI